MADNTENQLDILPHQRDETTVGNYFVSNYPPFSQWSMQGVGDALGQLECNASAATPMGLYLHIPFCRKRCHFCYFRVYTDKNKEDIRQYLDAMIEEVSLLAAKPFVSKRRLKFIYFGGGTPSYLSARQLEYLVAGLQQALPWDDVKEVTFECEPGTLNEGKLAAIRSLGVTRLSLGVENFDDHVLRTNNRAHESKEIYRAYEWAQSVGFPQVNIDLIAGMVGETEENWQKCVDETIKLKPDAVTIYQMEIPYNTTVFQQMQGNHVDVAPVADWPTKRRWVSDAFDSLEASGYTVASAYTAVRHPENTEFVYRDALWNGADMFGVGVSSFGYLAGVHYQNQAHMAPYISAIEDKSFPIYRALRTTREEQLIRQFVLKLKLGQIDSGAFMDEFGVNVIDRWRDVLKTYENEGMIEIKGDQIKLTRSGLLQVDRLLHGFFLPQHRGIRYT